MAWIYHLSMDIHIHSNPGDFADLGGKTAKRMKTEPYCQRQYCNL